MGNWCTKKEKKREKRKKKKQKKRKEIKDLNKWNDILKKYLAIFSKQSRDKREIGI